MSSSGALKDALRESLRASGLDLRREDERLVDAAASWPNAMADMTATILSARVSESALAEHALAIREAAAEHAAALRAAADGSNRYAASLGRATWALVGVTGFLFLATLLLAIQGF